MEELKEPLVVGEHTEAYIRSEIRGREGFLGELEKDGVKRKIPIIHPEVAKFLEVIIRMNSPQSILEIGTAIGFSTILLAQNMHPDGKIDSIELSHEMAMEANQNIETMGLSKRITVFEGDALDIVPDLSEKYDMIFLDGPKGQYLRLLPHCVRLLNQKGLLITDNTFYRGMVAVQDERIPRRRRTMVRRLREYITCICNHEELETSLLPIADGMALSIKK